MSWQAEAEMSAHVQSGGSAVFWQSVSVCLVLAGAGLSWLAFHRVLEESLMLVLLGIYAGVGMFFLLCTAFGVCRFTLSDPRRMPVVHMLDQLPEALVLTSDGGRIIYMNEGYRQLAGFHTMTPEILLARDETAARAIYRLSLAAREGRAVCCEIKLTESLLPQDNARQRGTFVYSVAAKPFVQDGYAMVLWAITDLTGQRTRQEVFVRELQDAVNHLDHAPAGFVSWDRDERVVYLNATLARWRGVDLSRFTPGLLFLSDLVGARNAEEIRRRMENIADRHMIRIETDCEDDERQSCYLRFYVAVPAPGYVGGNLSRAVVLRDDGGEAGSSLSEIIDTVRDGLHFDDYFDVSPVALAVINRDGMVERANALFLTLFNLDETGTIAARRQSFVSVLELQDQGRVARAVQQIFAGSDESISPIDAVFGSEKKRYIRLYISPVGRDETGCEAVVISVVETTEQRALEQQMEQSQKMQAVGQLAGGIAHDFNNVLTAIIMSCDLLLGSHRSSDPSHPDIMNIKNNANRAASLVRQLLAFSRRQTLRPEVLDLTDVLADLRMLVARLVGSNVQLHIEHGRALWPVRADQAELERVIMNLAANSRDAMLQGGQLVIRTGNVTGHESRQLDYQGFQPGDYVLIEVSDTGSGIAPDILGKIFDPFFTTKEVGKGTGLGLSMVYGIVSQTGGYIHCRSTPGEGTCFSIYLPRYVEETLRKAKMQEENIEVEKKAGDSRLVDLSGSANVLLVEDEDAVRMGGVKALQSRGYTVFEAASGVEALKVIKEQKGKIDIVVSDVVMPEMDGPTLLKELRKLFPDIKFIFVSGYAQDAFARNLPEDAAFAFLAKPFSLKQLAMAVKEMLNGNND